MMYLHKSVFQSHGYLSSANCHVDNRWVLKVAGFSLNAFGKENCMEQVRKTAVSLILMLTYFCNYLFIKLVKIICFARIN